MKWLREEREKIIRREASETIRIEDRARLMRLLADKIERKLKRNKDEGI